MPAHPEFRHGQVVHIDLAANQRTVYYDIDDDHGALVTEVIDPTLILDANTELRNATAGQKFGDMAHVGSVPMNIFEEVLFPAMQAGDDEYVKKWLNDADNRGFRTKEGHL